MTRYEQGFLTRCAEYGLSKGHATALLKTAHEKKADSLSDEELADIAKYYNKYRNDRLTPAGDLGRYLLTGGNLAGVMSYDLNRTGGTQLLAPLIGGKAFNYKKRTQKELDKDNMALKAMSFVLGGVAGAGLGNAYSDSDKAQNTAIGGAIGAGSAFILTHLAQKLGQIRARRMLKRLKEEQQEQ